MIPVHFVRNSLKGFKQWLSWTIENVLNILSIKGKPLIIRWTPSNIDSILIFTHINALFNTECMRRISDITSFLNGCWNKLFYCNPWQSVSSRRCHMSKQFAQCNKLWVAFTVAMPLKVIRHTMYPSGIMIP
jgi:hypothetical protein